MAVTGIDGGATEKVLLGDEVGIEPDIGFRHATTLPQEPSLATDAENAADDLVKLVLALVDTVRQLLERQAIRRMENGVLSDDEIERLGLTLLRLEERMAELKAHFAIEEEDLALRLGTVQDLIDVLEE